MIILTGKDNASNILLDDVLMNAGNKFLLFLTTPPFPIPSLDEKGGVTTSRKTRVQLACLKAPC